MSRRVAVVLTVAGSDSGGGAGVQADLRAFGALGVWGACALTSVTAQNTMGVVEVFTLPVRVVRAQLEAVADDFEVHWAKTGALGGARVARLVARFARDRGWRLVVDPVAAAHAGGAPLWRGGGRGWRRAYREAVLPSAWAATPNAPEAAALAGLDVRDAESMAMAAQLIRELGPRVVVVKGGHLRAPDLFFDGKPRPLVGRWVEGGTHGGGCTFSAAFTALLALGRAPLAAAREARAFTARAIAASPGVGHGEHPVWAGRVGRRSNGNAN